MSWQLSPFICDGSPNLSDISFFILQHFVFQQPQFLVFIAQVATPTPVHTVSHLILFAGKEKSISRHPVLLIISSVTTQQLCAGSKARVTDHHHQTALRALPRTNHHLCAGSKVHSSSLNCAGSNGPIRYDVDLFDEPELG
jgi:hypothetical protein